METKLLFFLLSGILFQSNIGIYMMEQTEKCQVTLKIAIQMHTRILFLFFLITSGGVRRCCLVGIYINCYYDYSKNVEWDE